MYSKGQSIIEIIIAVAIMVIIASGAVVAIIGSFSTSRLAEEESQATLIAVEGMEAVQSIRNQGWDNIVDGTYGLTSVNGFWEFSGTSDTDPTGKFTRVVNVNPVNRNINGDIVTGSGLNDPETKEIEVIVSWDFTSSRSNSVSMNTILTNWQSAVDPGSTNPSISSCQDVCLGNEYSGGMCRKSESECVQAGETYEASGDQFCTQPPDDTCCCQ